MRIALLRAALSTVGWPSVDIRPFDPADADALWTLLEPVFRAGDTYAVDPNISRDAALAMWVDTPAATFVVEDAGAILGTYYIKTNQKGGGAHVCNCGYITAAAARGQGLASAMCAHSLGAAKALGYKAMQFNFVLTSNEGAIRLWERAGFETVGRIPEAFQHPSAGLVDALVMYRKL